MALGFYEKDIVDLITSLRKNTGRAKNIGRAKKLGKLEN
jgi:hypothetical protein